MNEYDDIDFDQLEKLWDKADEETNSVNYDNWWDETSELESDYN